MTTPTPLSRGEFGLTGARRILALLKSHGIRATWFVPGFTIESHPTGLRDSGRGRPRDRPSQLGAHPAGEPGREEEEADLVRANEAIRRLTGRKARGYRSPSWDLTRTRSTS